MTNRPGTWQMQPAGIAGDVIIIIIRPPGTTVPDGLIFCP